ncbi:hypothetical protein [Amycolatopsis sp. NPDC098790]|uniref:methylation-associated defense system protein MAD7 n=1 Tax=Amycolatopsis sp. NPDC098790 TaxID=3363939 RepID=UPI003830DB5F
MGLRRNDKEFRHAAVSYVDYKQLDMDRVLTGLLGRLWFKGPPSVLKGAPSDQPVERFVSEMMKRPDWFEGFDPDITRRWLETDLLDLVNRGKPTQAVAGLRPLHGFTYRFRVGRLSRPYGADEQLYWMIHHAPDGKGPKTLGLLRDFFFAGMDLLADRPAAGADIDVETQTLINMNEAFRNQITDRAASDDRRSYPPLEIAASELLADDIIRLLYHKDFIPRSVIVDHLKILLAFHLARYHFRIMKSLPSRLARQSTPPEGGFFLDIGGIPGTATAHLAERSARSWYARIPGFVLATFTVKKLDELATQLVNARKLSRPPGGMFTLENLLDLLGPKRRDDRTAFAENRLSGLTDTAATGAEGVDRDITDILELGLDPFTTYIEIITAYRVRFHRRYLTDCLDSLLLKNRPGAMIAQPRGGQRRFVLDSRLLEVLLQLALLRGDGSGGLHTRPIRIDELLETLRTRYGLYVDRLPTGDGFDGTSITDQQALQANRDAFVARLREIGFYNDLSDAYLTQTIAPRYRIEADTTRR